MERQASAAETNKELVSFMKVKLSTTANHFSFAAAMTAGLAAACLPVAGAPLSFYVAPNGSDAWSGRLAAPNHHGDGPFATVGAAQRAVIARKVGGGLPGQVTVWIRGGTYRLARPLQFLAADSGSPGAPIIYAAYRKETPIFTGDKPIAAHWKPSAENPQIEETVVPGAAQGGWNFNRLTVGGAPASRARVPVPGKSFATLPFDSRHPAAESPALLHFYARPGDINPQWTNLSDIEMSKLARYTNSHEYLAAVDPVTSLVTAAAPLIKGVNSYNYDYPGYDRYFLDNVFEGLTPGTWYLNRHTGNLYYWPARGKAIRSETFAAPAVSQLLTVEGTPAAPVHDLVFRGLTFTHTSNPLPRTGYAGFVAVLEIPDLPAVGVKNAAAISFLGNTVHDVTGAAYRQTNSSRCLVSGNRIYNASGSGIQIGDPGEVSNTRAALSQATAFSGNAVADNTIHDIGLTYLESPGIMVYHQQGADIAHNLIYNVPGSGIYLRGDQFDRRIGGNTIAGNRIFNAMQQIDDCGGIYLINADAGCRITGNVVHDIGQYGRFYRAGIYLDVGSTEVTVQGNLVYRTMCDMMMDGGRPEATTNIAITDNIFADASYIGFAYQQDAPNTVFGITFTHNIVFIGDHLSRPVPVAVAPLGTAGRYPFSQANALAGQVTSDDNLFYNPLGRPDWRNGVNTWRHPDARKSPPPAADAVVSDAHSLETDPEFTNYAQDNFTLRRSSPAFSLGIDPGDFAAAGPRTALPKQPPRRASRKPM